MYTRTIKAVDPETTAKISHDRYHSGHQKWVNILVYSRVASSYIISK